MNTNNNYSIYYEKWAEPFAEHAMCDLEDENGTIKRKCEKKEHGICVCKQKQHRLDRYAISVIDYFTPTL